MNKIYKVIWSKVKHQYVVVSELAHSCTKSTTSRVGRSAAAALAALVLTVGIGFPVQAEVLTENLDAQNNNISNVDTLTADTVVATSSLYTTGLVQGNSIKVTDLVQGNNIQGNTGNIGGVSFTDNKVTVASGAIGGVTLENGTLSANGKTLDIEAAASAVENAANALAAAQANTETLGEYEAAGIVPGTIHDNYDGTVPIGAIAIGEGSEVLGDKTTAVGANSKVTGGYGTAVGNGSTVNGVWGTALGTGSTAAGWATAFGGASNAAEKATAVGYHAHATGNGSVALGEESQATGIDSIAHGRDAKASGDNAVAIGAESNAAADNAIAIGKGATVQATGGEPINSVALGVNSLVTGNNSIAMGFKATANANAAAIGDQSKASGNHSSAFGTQSNATAESATALGYLTSATAKNSVALGANSVANEEDTISVGRYDKDSSKYNFQRRITNVKEGINDYDAVNVKQMNQAVDGVVKWDDENQNSIHGVGLDNGNITGTSLVTNSEIAGQNYSVKIENGAITTTGNAKSTIGGVTFVNGKMTAGTGDNVTVIDGGSIASKYINSQSGNIGDVSIENGRVDGVDVSELDTTVGDLDKNAVKWDNDDQNTIKGVEYQGDGNLKVNDLAAGTLNAADGAVKVDEDGNFSAGNGLFTVSNTGAISAGMTDGPSFALNESGVHMNAGNGSGLDVTTGGTTFTGANGTHTYINGNEINTNTVLAGEMYVGTKAEGNAVVTKDQLNGKVDEATEGVVKWDTNENGDYQPGNLTVTNLHAGEIMVGDILGGEGGVLINPQGNITATGTITSPAMNTQELWAGNQGSFHVTPEGSVTMTNNGGEQFFLTEDALMLSSVGESGNAMITLSDGHLNLLGGGQQMSMTNDGVVFRDVTGGTSTTIQGDTITTGTINAEGVTVGGKNVATVDDVTNATKDAVKYDENGELHAGKDGTGSLVLGKDNGSASLISENEKHSISVNNDGTTIEGGLNVKGGLTVDGKEVATSGDVTEVKTDVSGIKNQIGVNEDGSYKTINNGAADVISGINTNTDSINTINSQIGGSGENGALKLSNGATTIEKGINANTTMIQQNSQAIGQLGHKVGELDSRIDEVGAGAAALAALHPLDFDPDAKWDFAAGYGNYRGENAVAVGTFYRPNEDVMFSVGGTFGNDDNMVNAGVSFKIGAGSSHVTTSRTAMAKEIKSMRDIVAKQDAQIQKLTAMVNALVGAQTETDTTTMFPDVPENHWAYDAVAAIAKTGLLDGYPDGEFKGDRNMTRYEFAQIVYNAIQAGIKVDERLVQEFKPELEYFHIDTVAKDKDGNPTIERVRAN